MKSQSIDLGGVVIPSSEIEVTVSTSGGPGGQHANKTSTKVTLRWSIVESKALNATQRKSLQTNLRSRLTTLGELIISVSDTRSQSQNYTLALERFRKLIKKGLHRPKKRKPTKPSKSSIRKRIDTKKQRGQLKKMRQQPPRD